MLKRLIMTGAFSILASMAGSMALVKDWGTPKYSHCVQPYNWSELVYGFKNNSVSFKTGGLGRLLEPEGYQTWQCFLNHYCAVEPDDPWMCFVYHETDKVFTPWGENSRLKLVRVGGEEFAERVQSLEQSLEQFKRTAAKELEVVLEELEELKMSKCFQTPLPFFNVSRVRYPSSYNYSATYVTKRLVPVPGYSAGTATFSSIDISSTISRPGKYLGGVLAPNGKVIFVPYYADNIGMFDPLTNAFTIIDISGISGIVSGASKYAGGVLAPNGKIIFVPRDADNIGTFDLLTNIFVTIDISDTISSGTNYIGGVLAPNGKIIFVPFSADNIGEFDPSTNTFTTIDISDIVSGAGKYHGGVLAPNGKIIFVPHHANNIGEFNPSTSIFTTIDISGTISSNSKYIGGVLAPNGKIIFVPVGADKIGEFDPSTNVFATIDISGIVSGAGKYHGGVLATNGKIIFVPYDADNIGEFDPSTNIFTTINIASTISSDGKYIGGILAPNGKIICVPRNANNIGMLELGNTEPTYEVSGGVSESWSALLSPHFNKH